MSKVIDAANSGAETNEQPEMIDSKYRLIIVAAKRSKQLLRGARPRVEMDSQKHKPTRIALEEVQRHKVPFEILNESEDK
ncbi:MAG TPA: DNA-directed RNA polymerase subunit omega [Pyrinomonadaceae bacterium]|jgi:DNA-directed RNA polymerase subunit omega|nr:DNA-directed RNA polymerase subunit omega [Pyrinomonadaceae bacterium]